MTLTQLEYFCAVCRYHNITRAAAELFVTQPTISQSIRELEHELRLRLFVHDKNRISLTEEGEAFYRRAEALLRESERLYEDFSPSGRVQKPLRIGIPPMLGTIYFPALAEAFRKETELPIELYEYGSVRACELVAQEELDAAIANLDIHNIDTFNYHVMTEEKYVFCVARSHPLADAPELSFESLEGEPLILNNTDSVQSRTILSRFRAHNMTPHILLRSSQLPTIRKFLLQGNCGAFLYASVPAGDPELRAIPIRPAITSRIGVVWKKGVFVSDRILSFVGFVKHYTV